MRTYEHDALYEAEIVDQELVKKNDGTFAAVLTLEPQRKMKDKFNPAKGVAEELPTEKRIGQKVWLNLTGATLDKSISYLRSLGFNSYQYTRLNPEHPHFHDLRGKKLYAQCSYAPDKKDTSYEEEGRKQNEKEWWNIRLFKAVKTAKEQLAEQEALFKEQEEAFKDAYENVVANEEAAV